MTEDMTSLPDGLVWPARGSPTALALPSGLEYGFIHQEWNSDAAESDRVVGAALRASGTAAAFQSWHEDTFTLPPGAIVLSSRENCPAQAFKLPPLQAAAGTESLAWGFQYHSALNTPSRTPAGGLPTNQPVRLSGYRRAQQLMIVLRDVYVAAVLLPISRG